MSLPALDISPHGVDFIDDGLLHDLLARPRPDAQQVRDIVAKSMAKQALSVAETAVLLRADDPALTELIFESARELKRRVYGNRIVLFAPLYIGNMCVNDCTYCGFRRSNREAVRRTLTPAEVVKQVEALEAKGHKRLILVFGEHPAYDAQYIAETVRTVYGVKVGHGEIRRVNINAAPMDVEGYRAIKAAGIGTYQVFQETYHKPTYAITHPAGTRKGDYRWRLDALSRAQEGGIDDVGNGALFGLYDWRFEVLGLVSHALHLQERFHVGPHTISFPRLRPASGVKVDERWLVGDHDFKRLIAILRLAVPYTGLILTAREPAALRRECLAFGVSQIDAGSRVELGGYTEAGDAQVQVREKEQFELGDIRPLDAVIRELLEDGYIPSFCTACYRLGRTGEHFMEFAIPGFIKEKCTPNALSTLQEYLVDYASPACRTAGEKLIDVELAAMPEGKFKEATIARLKKIRGTEERDLYV
jgi:2-iminoacetate synthase